MPHLTLLDPEWRAVLEKHVDSAKPDAVGNCDNVALVQASWVALLADCPGSQKPSKVLNKFFKRIQKDYTGMLRRAGELYQELLSSVVRLPDGTYHVESLHTKFGTWPIFREYKKWYDTGDDKLLTYLGTFLSWGRKAEFIDPSLTEKALADWLQIESDLCRLDPPQKLLEDLRFVLSHLPEPDIEDVDFKFGPGKVSEKDIRVYSDKLLLRYHPGLDYMFDLVARDAPGLRLVMPNPMLWWLGTMEKESASITYATLMMVVKDRFSERTICKEPNSLMYGQQGAQRMLLRAIARSPFRRMINIEDQTLNQRAALEASVTGLYDTIDLSSASDRLSNRIVRQIFPSQWNNIFQQLRSSHVRLPNGRIKKVEKHAPMGSALCFPIQTLVFTAVTCVARFISSQDCTFDQYLEREGLMMHKLRFDPKVRVYGDDIICHRRETGIVMSILESLGFKVNARKSFYGPRAFRESCGTYAMRGTIVTPLLFKVKGLAAQDPSYIDGLIDLCNRLFVAGYYSTQAFLAGYLPRQFYVEVPESELRWLMPYHLLTVEPDNSPLKHRVSPVNEKGESLQRDEIRIKRYTTVTREVDYVEDVRYRVARFYMAPTSTEGDKPQIGDALGLALRRVWVAA